MNEYVVTKGEIQSIVFADPDGFIRRIINQHPEMYTAKTLEDLIERNFAVIWGTSEED